MSKRKHRDYFIVAGEDSQIVKLSDLALHYPEFDWLHEKCAFCNVPAIYLLCIKVDADIAEYANYEPKNPNYRMAVFELRSEFDTNFEFPVCETHIYGEPQ